MRYRDVIGSNASSPPANSSDRESAQKAKVSHNTLAHVETGRSRSQRSCNGRKWGERRFGKCADDESEFQRMDAKSLGEQETFAEDTDIRRGSRTLSLMADKMRSCKKESTASVCGRSPFASVTFGSTRNRRGHSQGGFAATTPSMRCARKRRRSR